MSMTWLLSTANAVFAAVLLYASMFKLAQPGHLRRALAEVGGRHLTGVGNGTVRAIAATEAVAGAAITIPATRMLAAPVVVLLGVAFAAAGIAGVARRGVEPCGCLGVGPSAPLGARSIAAGAAIAAVGMANFSTPANAVPAATASLLLATCLVTHHATARQLLWPSRSGV
jgi:hypothetical protein